MGFWPIRVRAGSYLYFKTIYSLQAIGIKSAWDTWKNNIFADHLSAFVRGNNIENNL